jgi:YggT family protein
MVRILFELADVVLSLYRWAIILAAVYSMLVSFGVLDTRNRIVWTIGDFLTRVTEPVLRPIRNILPHLGNIDISPIIALVLIEVVIRPLLRSIYAAIEFGAWQGLLF